MRYSAIAFIVTLLAPSSYAALSLSFAPDAVEVGGARPGTNVVFFFVARQRVQESLTQVRRGDREVIAESNGVARFVLGGAVPRNSIWVAVDLASGEAISGTPPDSAFRRVALPEKAWRRKDGVAELLLERSYVDLFWARPGGAWRVFAAEGGTLDTDHTDTALSLDPRKFKSIGKSDKPDKYRKGDVVVIVDPFAWEYIITEVSE